MLRRIAILPLFLFVLAGCTSDPENDLTCTADDVREGSTCVDGIWIKDADADAASAEDSAADESAE